MKFFLRILFIFICFCLSFFVNQESVYAINNSLDFLNNSFISDSKPTIIKINKTEDYYILTQKNSKAQVLRISNKKYNFDNNSNNNHFLNNLLKDQIYNPKDKYNNRITHNIYLLNLKNAVYTRAP